MTSNKEVLLNSKIESQDFSSQTNIDNVHNICILLKKQNNSNCFLIPKKFRVFNNVKESFRGSIIKQDDNFKKLKSEEMILTKFEEKFLDTFLSTNIPKPPKRKKNIDLPFIEEPKHYSKSISTELSKTNSRSMPLLTFAHKMIRDRSKTHHLLKESDSKQNRVLIQKQYENNKSNNAVHQAYSMKIFSKYEKVNNKKANAAYRGFCFYNDEVNKKLKQSLFNSPKANNAKLTHHNSYYANFA